MSFSLCSTVVGLMYWVGCPSSFAPCETTLETRDLMTSVQRFEPMETWIDLSTYELLLADLKTLPDPTILLLGGMLFKDGRVEISHVTELPLGKPSRLATEGDHSFAFKSFDGTDLEPRFFFSRAFDKPIFNHSVGKPPAAVSALALKLPYPAEAARLVIRRGETVLLEFDPVSLSLRKMIEAIPDRGYDKNPEQRRRTLLEKVEAFERMMEKKEHAGALQKLSSDIRDKVEKWLVPFAVRPSANERTQAEVLAQIGRIETRERAWSDVQPAASSEVDEDQE